MVDPVNSGIVAFSFKGVQDVTGSDVFKSGVISPSSQYMSVLGGSSYK
jgi:hypothetical protein